MIFRKSAAAIGTRHQETVMQKERGFTAIELLVAVAIVPIVAAVSMPFFLAAMESSRLNGAARRIAGDLRLAQSLAVSRGGIYGWHWGGDPNGAPPGPTFYRIEKDTGTACNWPAVGDTISSNGNVVSNWFDLSRELPGITIVSFRDNNGVTVGGAAFNAQRASVNPCAGVTYPISITVKNASGGTRTIQVRSAGSVRIQ